MCHNILGFNIIDVCAFLEICVVYRAPDKKGLQPLTLLHSERPKLYTILAFLSAIELRIIYQINHKNIG